MSSELTEILARIRHVEESVVARNNLLTYEVITLNKLLRERQGTAEDNESTKNMFEELFARVQLMESNNAEHKKTTYFLHGQFEKLQYKVESILSKLEHEDLKNTTKSSQFFNMNEEPLRRREHKPVTQLPFPNLQSKIEEMIAMQENAKETEEPLKRREHFPMMGVPFQPFFVSHQIPSCSTRNVVFEEEDIKEIQEDAPPQELGKEDQ